MGGARRRGVGPRLTRGPHLPGAPAPLPEVLPPPPLLPPVPGRPAEPPLPPAPVPVVPPAPLPPPSTPPSGMVGPVNRHQLNLKRSPLPPTNFRNRSCFPLPPVTVHVLVVQDEAPETSHVPSSVPV